MKSLHLAAVLGLVAGMNSPYDRPSVYDGMRRSTPINTERRAEKDAAALRKAQVKRDRKNAKRMEQANG